MGEVAIQREKYDDALKYFSKAAKLRNDIKDQYGTAQVYGNLSAVHAKLGNMDSAFYYLNESQANAIQLSAKHLQLTNYYAYVDLYSQEKKYDKAFEYQNRLMALRDTVFNQTLTRNVTDIKFQFQDELSKVKLQGKDREISSRTNQTYSIAAFSLVALLAAVGFYRSRNRERRFKNELTQKNSEVLKQKEELQLSNESLTRLNLEKNNLIGIVAHDLKSPLNQIKGLLSLIKMLDKVEDEETAGYLSLAGQSTTRLHEMITKILDVEAIEARQLNLKLESVNLSEVLNGVAERYEKDASKKTIKINKQIAHDVTVEADRSYVEQVLENLISNAIKFSPFEKNIFIHLVTESGKAICKIRDEGPGLNEEDMKNIFGKYQKLSAKPTGGESSTGLGLSIVKKFVEAMNGEIWCESQTGKGAVFYVKLCHIH